MNALGSYKKQSLFGGWTRVELLLEIYSRAIRSIEAVKLSMESADAEGYAKHLIDSQKAILAIHSGLKPDEHDVAFNIARLLHFVLVCLEKAQYDDALKILRELHDGFAAVADDVNELERSGEIPPLPTADQFESIA